MTTMENKTHCAWCRRGLGEKNRGKGIGPECKTKLPDTINVALLNRSEHGYHARSHEANDLHDAFKHFGDSVDILIFADTDGFGVQSEEWQGWETYFKSEDGIICIDSNLSRYEGEAMPAVADEVAKWRRRVAVMCDPNTTTKVELVHIDSDLGYLMNRGFYNGPYPIGMDLKEWATEIYGIDSSKIPQCMGCGLMQHRLEEKSLDEEEIELVQQMIEQADLRFGHTLFCRVMRNHRTQLEEMLQTKWAYLSDITQDPLNDGSKAFIGGPQHYDWSESYEHFYETNIVRAGELVWDSEYGRRVFEYCLLPYLMKGLSKAYHDDWEPADEWSHDYEGYLDHSLPFWAGEATQHGRWCSEDSDLKIRDGLIMDMAEYYPHSYGGVLLSNGKAAEDN
jgi:hypothetical protein